MYYTKRVVSLLVCFAVLIGIVNVFNINAFAVADPTVNFEIQVSEINNDGTVTVSAIIPDNVVVSYLEMNIKYNSDLFSFVSGSCTLPSGSFGPIVNSSVAGRYRVVWVASKDITSRTVVATLILKLNDNVCGEGDFYLEGNISDNEVGSDELTIISNHEYRYSGLVDLIFDDNGYCYNGEKPKVLGGFSDGSIITINGCTFSGLGNTTGNTNVSVSCDSVTKTLSANVIEKGDNNGDGTADINDYAVMKERVIEGVRAETVDDKYKYDLITDGAVDGFDLFQLDKIINGYA